MDANNIAVSNSPLVDAGMPVKDAIDLADFLVYVTWKYFAFPQGQTL
ncbi:MAG: hypothetical protein OXE85_04950 [Roseovarius sp.]|nr:hypothetical protein [Roseovarius sp.]